MFSRTGSALNFDYESSDLESDPEEVEGTSENFDERSFSSNNDNIFDPDVSFDQGKEPKKFGGKRKFSD